MMDPLGEKLPSSTAICIYNGLLWHFLGAVEDGAAALLDGKDEYISLREEVREIHCAFVNELDFKMQKGQKPLPMSYKVNVFDIVNTVESIWIQFSEGKISEKDAANRLSVEVGATSLDLLVEYWATGESMSIPSKPWKISPLDSGRTYTELRPMRFSDALEMRGEKPSKTARLLFSVLADRFINEVRQGNICKLYPDREEISLLEEIRELHCAFTEYLTFSKVPYHPMPPSSGTINVAHLARCVEEIMVMFYEGSIWLDTAQRLLVKDHGLENGHTFIRNWSRDKEAGQIPSAVEAVARRAALLSL